MSTMSEEKDLRPDFLMVPYILIADKNLQSVDRLLYGAIYWYTRMKLQKCIASNKTLAEVVGVKTEDTISSSLKRLEDAGYIKRIMSKEFERAEIIGLIAFGRIEDSTNISEAGTSFAVPRHLKNTESGTSSAVHNNNIINNNIKKEIVTTLQSEPKALAPKEDKRNPDIQEVYEYGLSKGFVGIKQQYQRYAIKRLLGKIEKNKLLRLVDFTQQIRKDQYAPQVNTFLDMEYKLANLRDYMARKQTKAKTIVKI